MEEVRCTYFESQRRKNTIIAMIHVFVLGFEYAAIIVSLLYYIQEEIDVENPHLYYGLITAAFFFSASLSGIIFGRYVDRTRNVKSVILFNALVSVVGNIMYTVPYSVWFLIIGRFLNGFMASIQPIMCGEFNKIYASNEVGKVISKYQLIFGIGYTIGPATSAMFKGVDIVIIKDVWRITQYNAIGSLLTIFNLSVAILILCFYSNIVAEKSNNSSCNSDAHVSYNCGDDTKVTIQVEEPQKKLVSCSYLCQLDIALLIVSASFAEASSTSLEIVVNMIANTTFGWSLKEISITSTIAVILAYIIIILAIYKDLFEGIYRAFVTYMICLIVQSTLLSIATIPYFTSVKTFWIQALLFGTMIGSTCFVFFALMSVAKLLVFHVVPRHSSSFVDGLRTSLSLILTTFSYLFSSYMFFNGKYVFPPSVFILIIFIVIFLIKQRVYYYEVIIT